MRIAAILFSLFFVAGSAAAQDWQLVWSDEFDVDGSPDPSKWVFDIGSGGWGNQELQYYTDRTENVVIEDGILKIHAINEYYSNSQYTSGRITTRGKASWLYGRVDVRAKLPIGRGTWSAIWMLPEVGGYGNGGWPDNGEIDIMEHVGYDPTRIHSTVHTNAANGLRNNASGSALEQPDVQDEFHVYSVEWTPRSIRMYMDERMVHEVSSTSNDWRVWPFDQPMHLLLNVAIGGNWGGIEGVDDSAFPTTMQIDYVRVFEDASAQPSLSVTTSNASDTFSQGDTLRVAVDAQDATSTIAAVAFRQGEGEMIETTSEPYTLEWSNLYPGCYELFIEAKDAEGWTTEEGPIPVQVGSSCDQAPYLMKAWQPGERIEAEYYDLGGRGVAYLDFNTDNTGGLFRASEGADIAQLITGGFALMDTRSREWVEYTFHVPADGTYHVTAQLSATAPGSVGLDVDGSRVADLAYSSTSSTTTFQSYSSDTFELTAGDHVLRVAFQSGGLQLDWIVLESISGTQVEKPGLPDRLARVDIFPNPVVDHVTVRWTDGARVERAWIVDMLGRRMPVDMRVGETKLTAQLPRGLAPGVYVFLIEYMDASIRTARFVVRRP